MKCLAHRALSLDLVNEGKIGWNPVSVGHVQRDAEKHLYQQDLNRHFLVGPSAGLDGFFFKKKETQIPFWWAG